MKKRVLILVVLLLTPDAMAVAGGDGGITASVNLYSGRKAPVWTMSSDEVALLKENLEKLPVSGPFVVGSWGYIVINNEGSDPSLPYGQVFLYKGKVVAVGLDGSKKYFSDASNISGWLRDLGNEHDPNYVPPKYLSLPPGTPYMVVFPVSINATAEKNAPLEKRITIFSEGNALLEGTVSVPEFIKLEKRSFSLAPIESGEDFDMLMDTSKEGQFSGDVIVRSNDPSSPEIRIPVRLIIVGSSGLVESPVEGPSVGSGKTGTDNSWVYAVLFVITALLFLLLLLLRKRGG